jgi:multicomponent Na+:H+ antiporter subunit G
MLASVSVVLLLAGALFFLGGSVGLLRFPDVYTRLHALTKADNLGLGFVVLGLMLQAESFAAVGKLFVIWLLLLAASATASQLVASWAQGNGFAPWRG